jgi:hypothetical protein
VAFLNENGDIIVGHSGNLSKLDFSNYKDKPDRSFLPLEIESGKTEKEMLQEKSKKYSGPNVSD